MFVVDAKNDTMPIPRTKPAWEVAVVVVLLELAPKIKAHAAATPSPIHTLLLGAMRLVEKTLLLETDESSSSIWTSGMLPYSAALFIIVMVETDTAKASKKWG